jgi:hypothetical protein
MNGDFFLVGDTNGTYRVPRRLPVGGTFRRNEAWLRDLLLKSPHIIPVDDIDGSFGPLVPLCSGLASDGGTADLAFISPGGLLTLAECKLWRHPKAPRDVISRLLDCARAITRWTYADLQRQVAKRAVPAGGTPYDLVRDAGHDVLEPVFADRVSRSLREGRFLLLIAGDGLHAGAGAFAELINHQSAMAFSFGLFDVALCPTEGGIAIQPRVLAQTVTL